MEATKAELGPAQVRCYTFLTSLLQCLGQNFYMNYIQIVVFLYIIAIEGHYFLYQ